MKDLAFILRVLGITSEYEACESVSWATDAERSQVSFFVNCNDLFFWGCADAEEVTPDNLDEFEKAFADAKAAKPVVGACDAGSLFCCRVRKMRPQGACYKHYEKSMWPLFDVCGPIRETGVGNPHKHPNEVGAP